MKENNVVVVKSRDFAIRIIKLYQHLSSKKGEHVLSKQVLRSGTSIGANIREAIRAQSRADFVSKMQIALKEASETEYWIDLLQATDYISENAGESLMADCEELIKLITSIVVSTKNAKQENNYEL